jgi:hypothetical protein
MNSFSRNPVDVGARDGIDGRPADPLRIDAPVPSSRRARVADGRIAEHEERRDLTRGELELVALRGVGLELVQLGRPCTVASAVRRAGYGGPCGRSEPVACRPGNDRLGRQCSRSAHCSRVTAAPNPVASVTSLAMGYAFRWSVQPPDVESGRVRSCALPPSGPPGLPTLQTKVDLPVVRPRIVNAYDRRLAPLQMPASRPRVGDDHAQRDFRR